MTDKEIALIASGTSYIKDTNDFLPKLKNLKKVPDNAILVHCRCCWTLS